MVFLSFFSLITWIPTDINSLSLEKDKICKEALASTKLFLPAGKKKTTVQSFL